MIDATAEATVVTESGGAGAAVVTVDGTGTIVDATPALGAIIGASDGGDGGGVELAGRSLLDLAAPTERIALQELLVATTDDERMRTGVRTIVAGRRDDGLPLLLDVRVPAAAPVTTNVPTDARITLVVERAGGPVAWADGVTPPAPERTGPDHVLSHDARAQVRNAKNFLGLFTRKLAESDLDPQALPAGFLDTSLRALATGDEILDRIVWFLRLEHDPIAMRDLSLRLLVETARRQSARDLEDLALLPEQADLVPPATVDVRLGNRAGGDGGDGEDQGADDQGADDRDGDDLAIVGNAELVAWVLQELFTNAVKFAKEPTALAVDANVRDGWVELRVTNRGHRIDASLAPDAFKLGRMLQGRGERPGVGLGLSLCRRIVLRHGGRVAIEPHEHGTVVTLRLPAAGADPVR